MKAAQKALESRKSVTLPKRSDQLWIVTDGVVKKHVHREGKLMPASFFSANLRKHQVSWLPCEIEALSIAVSNISAPLLYSRTCKQTI